MNAPFSKSPLNIGDVFTLSAKYIDRNEVEEADGGGEFIKLALSKGESWSRGCNLIEIRRPSDAPLIEKYQHLSLTVVDARREQWRRGLVTIVEAAANIIPFEPNHVTRVDGISLAKCLAHHDGLSGSSTAGLLALASNSATALRGEGACCRCRNRSGGERLGSCAYDWRLRSCAAA